MISSSGKPLSIFSAKDFHCSGSLLGRENNSIPRKLLPKQFCNPTGWSPFEFGIAARKAVRVGSMARMPMHCIFHRWLASQFASPLCSLASQFASQSPLCALASQSGLGCCLPLWNPPRESVYVLHHHIKLYTMCNTARQNPGTVPTKAYSWHIL